MVADENGQLFCSIHILKANVMLVRSSVTRHTERGSSHENP
jgi:hypothetical protein